MRPFVIVTAEQRSEEWKRARLGRLTGSVASDMLSKIKSGEAAGRRNLRVRLVLERVTGVSQESDYVSPAMQAGIDREADAFRAYEALTGNMTQFVGFVAHRSLMVGCSPDGHIEDFGKLMSIKCRQPPAHLEFLRSGKIPGDAMSQIRHELWITGALEHDYFSWNPSFPDALQSRVITIHRRDAEIDEYEREALAFLAEVDREVEAIRTMASPVAVLRAVAQGAA